MSAPLPPKFFNSFCITSASADCATDSGNHPEVGLSCSALTIKVFSADAVASTAWDCCWAA